MSVRNLDKLFKPRSVALIGATDREASVGAILLRNLRQAGFAGALYLVNPHRQTLDGMPVYPDVDSLPETPDLAVIVTRPDTVPGLVASLGARGTKAAVVITAGFGEVGDTGRQLQKQMLEAARPQSAAHRRTQLRGHHRAAGRTRCELLASRAATRGYRARQPIGGDGHRDAGLGCAARHRLLTCRLARGYGRCRFRGHARLSRGRPGHPCDPPIRRRDHLRAQVHVGRPCRRAQQAGAGAESRAFVVRLAGGCLTYRHAGRKRCSV